MTDKMTPIPFDRLMNRILVEYRRDGSVFGVRRAFVPAKDRTLPLFGERLETPFGPAAGPHTQLAQNIIAAYFAGARFFELKTVQQMDGEELSKCVLKPCITAEDECYNCEWSTELTVPEALGEYIKAWYALKLLTKAFGWGDPDGFIFNMSVGYDYDGITGEKVNPFIDSLMDASGAEQFLACRRWAEENLGLLGLEEAYLDTVSPKVCTSATLSTLHGCPPGEIERIAAYLIREKKLNTFVKCNPTILGYAFARNRLNALGFDYVSFDDRHFREDLQYGDAVPMFRRLGALAKENGLTFGLKLSNTFPVDVTQGELPSEEMYMSGRSLYPLTIEMARLFSDEFQGSLRISFSGGIDAMNAGALYEAGIWPITVATTLLKPGGYQRLTQLAETFSSLPCGAFTGTDTAKLKALSLEASFAKRYTKPVKGIPSRKMNAKVPLLNCFTAPCTHGCPFGQDVPEYLELCGQERYEEALSVILRKNPLPFITGTICAHHCMDKCTRTFYEESVHIREMKLLAAKNGFDAVLKTLKPAAPVEGLRVAVIGGGPAGMAAAFFLARAGAAVTLFEREKKLGGTVRYIIPGFRIPDSAIDSDAKLLDAMGVKLVTGRPAPACGELQREGYTHVLLAVGAGKPGGLRLQEGQALGGIAFLKAFKEGKVESLGRDVAVAGAGNTAMDVARAAKRVKGVERVRILYRRTRRFMPADEEELQLAMEEGVEFCELVSPVSLANGSLTCMKMELGEPDASGRRSPVATGVTVSLPCDTLIAATGEAVDGDFLKTYGVTLTEKGRAAVDGLLQSSADGVYVIGDAHRGPATVAEAIADARIAADAILGESGETSAARPLPVSSGQGILKEYTCEKEEPARCLKCSSCCECCVQVCPNRANVAIRVPGAPMPQILHLDALCNECGNCATFCPYNSRPYKDKLTLFATEEALRESTNAGFCVTGENRVLLRVDGKTEEIDLSGKCCLDSGLWAFIKAVLDDYAELL